VLPYIGAQLVGGILAAALLMVIASGADGFEAGDFASTTYDTYGVVSALLMEIVLTAVFLFVIMGVTHGKAPAGFAPLAIGLTLTLIHLAGIPVTGASVNPARSTATAIFAGGDPLAQIWLYWLAPIVGGGIGGFAYAWLDKGKPELPI